MSEINDKLLDFLDQGSYSALSGAEHALKLINQNRGYAVSHYYSEISGYGDASKMRGIREILEVMDLLELLDEREELYTTSNAELGKPFIIQEESADKAELYLNLPEGKYVIHVAMSNENGRFSADVEEKTGGLVRHAYDYDADEFIYFDLEAYEAGICKIEVRPRMGIADIKSVLVLERT